MRRIPLTIRLAKQGSPFPGSVIDAAVIKQIISIADPDRGMNLAEMRQGIKVLDALEAGSDTEFELENAEWEYLCAKIQTFRWAVADPRFVALVDTILQAEESPRGI